MKREPEALEQGNFDLLVVGGGITGACLAFDAATRGARVALIDKGDFGGATSAASSKLLHGGLRYLQQLRFGKVRESASERLYFQNLAPHLSRYVPFVVPTYRGLAKSKPVLSAGMLLYETLCIGQSSLLLDRSRAVPAGRGLGVDEVRELVPGVSTDGLTGGRLFYESHMHNSERMTLALVEGAASAGGTVANYVAAEEFLRDGDRVVGVQARSEEGDVLEVRARAVINAAGPWIRDLNAGLGLGSASRVVTGFSRGAHMVTRPLTDGHAVALPTRRPSESVIDRGGRHVFIIPWRQHSLIGTSYGPHDGPLDDVRPTAGEVDDLIEDINGALGAGTLSRDDVRYAFAGLYPLTADEIDPGVYQGSADYQVVDHGEADGVPGLFTVFGAKFTTARLLAERALDTILESIPGDWTGCKTRNTSLPSGAATADCGELPGGMAEDLIANHGAFAGRIADLARGEDLARPLGADRGVWAADVVWAVREEMASHLSDVVFRRTGLGTLGDPGEGPLAEAADIMAAELDWDAARTEREIAAVREQFQW